MPRSSPAPFPEARSPTCASPAPNPPRFNFDWDAKEDTTRAGNPLYAKLPESSILFGRGLVAGIDRREQLQVRKRLRQR